MEKAIIMFLIQFWLGIYFTVAHLATSSTRRKVVTYCSQKVHHCLTSFCNKQQTPNSCAINYYQFVFLVANM